MKLIFSFLFFSISITCYSQKIDSLYLRNLSKKVTNLNTNKKLDSAITQSHLLLTKAKTINSQYFELKAYNNLAKYYRANHSPFQSVKFYTKSKELNLAKRDTSKAINKLIYIANIQKKSGDFVSSENTAIEALKLTTHLPDSISIPQKIMLYNNLGMTSNALNNYNDAYKWYQKALNLTTKNSDIIILKNNIAHTLINLGEYSTAKDSLLNIFKSKQINFSPKEKSRILTNLGVAKSKIKEADGKQELIEGLKIREKNNDLSGQFSSYIHFTEYFADLKDSISALIYARKAYQTAIIFKSPISEVEALSFLIDLEDNPKVVASEYKKLTDSISRAREKAKNQFAKIKYETDQYREENLKIKARNAQQELNIQKQKNQKIIYSGIGALAILSSIYLFFYLKTKYKKEKLQEIYKTETRISKKVHDELANDVYQVMTQLQIKKNNDTTPIILDQLENIYSRTRDISRENNSIETGIQYINELKSMVSRYGSDQTNMIINGLEKEHWKHITSSKKIEIYRVLQELMTNMKKHSKASLVAITFKKEGNKMMIQYSDNGIGFSQIQQNIANGIHNVENRINTIGGNIIFDTSIEKGFKANISFPA